ncbi:galactokinase [Pontibacter sp. MBLB2868]|uniref:galactokinase n=1 Tax=Pontibacter sp. MBLB2868 TaxID=3451555 RepID=UPI003F7557C2
MRDAIRERFIELFSTEPYFFRSPGRVNLIGEHTDYNNGFVLPAAINKEILFAVGPNDTDTIRLFSYDMQEQATFDLARIAPSDISWANYLLGVVAQFQQSDYQVKGFDLVFGGNVPIGAGLSSSAAVECGLAFALNHIFGFGLDRFALAKVAQKAEHEFAGVRCGIMDQFASLFGKKEHVIKLDCRSLDYSYYHFEMSNNCIVLCDTQVKHSLASSEYNTRRQECETGVALLHKHYPDVSSLRDVTVDMLEKHRQEFDPVVFKRCIYIVQENSRVEAACRALEQEDLVLFGEKMFESHEGLQHNYEVSCTELDFLVDQAKEHTAVLGARMMGGGFGGCTINIVRIAAIDEFITAMSKAYEQQFKIPLKTYIAEIVDGSSMLS